MAIEAQRFLNSRTRWLVFGLIILVAFYLLAVTPARTYFEQRQEMELAQQRYDALVNANEGLRQRAAELQTDEAIARLAREKYELIPEGTTAYAVMPPSQEITNPAPDQSPSNGWFDKARDTIVFWDE